MGDSPSPSNRTNPPVAVSDDHRLKVNIPAKKMKPNVSILSPNPFAPLAEIEEMSTDSGAPTDKPIIPPPIFVNNVNNINLVIQEFRSYEPATFKYASYNDKIKINFMTIDGYRRAVNFLDDKKAEYYTYQLKSDRTFRVVIRGLHHTTDVSMIKEELRNNGYDCAQILPILHPVTKAPLPMFFVDLKPNPKNSEIYNLTRLYHAVVKVEPPRPKRTVIQCVKCQEFGHSKNYCHKKERCVKCDGNHATQDCPRPANSTPTCTNCHGTHTANYRGCPVHLQLQKLKHPSFISRPEPPKQREISDNRKSQFIKQTTQTGTYAEAVRSPNTESTRDGPDSLQSQHLATLIHKIDQLLSIVQPLVTALTQLLPRLISP